MNRLFGFARSKPNRLQKMNYESLEQRLLLTAVADGHSDQAFSVAAREGGEPLHAAVVDHRGDSDDVSSFVGELSLDKPQPARQRLSVGQFSVDDQLPLSATASNTFEHVIHISVDGVNSTILQNLMSTDPQNTSNWHRLVDEGASTFNARSDYTHTNTLPNHVSILTARPVLQPDGLPDTTHHGWIWNGTPTEDQTLHNGGNANVSYIASAFDVSHDSGMSTALFAGKNKFSLFDNSYNSVNGAADVTGEDNGTDKIDTFYVDVDTNLMQSTLLAELTANDFNYTFVHYRDPDSAGHFYEFGSSEYEESLRTVDGFIGEILSAVENDPQLNESTAVVLTSDHGGSPHAVEHAAPSDPGNYTIPMFVWGKDVAAGADLYTLNPERP